MAKRRLTSRQKRQRTRKIRNRVILILALLSLASAAMAPELRAYLTAKIHSGVQAFADLRTSEIDLVLPEKKIALLQLGVFDNGESAQSERARLAGLGVPVLMPQPFANEFGSAGLTGVHFLPEADAYRAADQVVTIGGIVGRVVAIKEDTFVLETGSDRVKIRFTKNAISSVEKLNMDNAPANAKK